MNGLVKQKTSKAWSSLMQIGLGRKLATTFMCLLALYSLLPRGLVVAQIDFGDIHSINTYTSHYDPESTGLEECSVGGATISGEDAIAQIFNYLIGKEVNGVPLEDYHVAGIMGNMQHESGYQPQRLQGTPPGTITRAEDVPRGQRAKAYGLVQWDPAHKMIDPVTQAGKDPNTIPDQLDFLLQQLNGETASPEGRAGQLLVDTTNVADATLIFETRYERHAGSPQPTRIVEAERILQLAQQGALIAAQTGGSGGQTVIALDPGHGGAVPEYTDTVTGLKDRETTNPQETQDVHDVANQVKAGLEQAGYRVIMLKTNATDAVSKRDRVDAAKAGGANLAISIHTTPPASFNQVWPQFVGGFRANREGDPARTTFENAEVAAESDRIADIMAATRSAAEGHTVIKEVDQTASFSSSRTPSNGNLSLVQLWATDFPWVYNEFGTEGALSEPQKTNYANGIIEGVKQALPSTGASGFGSSGGTCQVGGNGNIVSTALAYAWPDYRRRGSAGALDLKPEYSAAVERASGEGRYVGGIQYPGIDCGGFVTTAMIDSGFAPDYNYSGRGGNTPIQLQWVRDNWTKIGRVTSTDQLEPGDVAFQVKADGTNDGHTFVWVGDQPGFEYPVASSSLDQRAPMAGAESPVAGNIEWYRKN